MRALLTNTKPTTGYSVEPDYWSSSIGIVEEYPYCIEHQHALKKGLVFLAFGKIICCVKYSLYKFLFYIQFIQSLHSIQSIQYV